MSDEVAARKDAKDLALILITAVDESSGHVTFNRERGVFIVNGKTVSARTIRAYLNRIETKLARRMILLTDALESGKITLDEWTRQFESTIKTSHILAGALAVGGIAIASTNPAVMHEIREQLGFAKGFKKDLKRKKAGTLSKQTARVKSYFRSIWQTYAAVELAVVEAVGIKTEAVNMLTANENCSTRNGVIGCQNLTDKGWMPIKEIVLPGKRACKWHCKCFIRYR